LWQGANPQANLFLSLNPQQGWPAMKSKINVFTVVISITLVLITGNGCIAIPILLLEEHNRTTHITQAYRHGRVMSNEEALETIQSCMDKNHGLNVGLAGNAPEWVISAYIYGVSVGYYYREYLGRNGITIYSPPVYGPLLPVINRELHYSDIIKIEVATHGMGHDIGESRILLYDKAHKRPTTCYCYNKVTDQMLDAFLVLCPNVK
jgi:hypothetical protein